MGSNTKLRTVIKESYLFKLALVLSLQMILILGSVLITNLFAFN